MLDPKSKSKLLRANLTNIVRKVKAGKPLSAAELKLVRADEEEQNPNPLRIPEPSSPEDKHRAFDSIAAAAAWLAPQLDLTPNRAKTLLRSAKKAGLPGFRGSRVYAADLMPALGRWLKSQEHSPAGLETKEELECRRLRGLCEKIEFQNKVEQGDFAALAELNPIVIEIESRTTALLRQKLENEFPVAAAGQEPSVIRVLGKRLVDDICAQRAALWKRFAPAT
jgi:hypothetical protein